MRIAHICFSVCILILKCTRHYCYRVRDDNVTLSISTILSLITCDRLPPGAQGDFWEKHDYDLKKYNGAGKDFEVVIEARVGKGHLGDIAIDDISLSRHCSRAMTELPGHPTGTVLPPMGRSGSGVTAIYSHPCH